MLCVEYYSEKGKGRIYSFLVNFFAGRRKYFPEIRIYRSDVINNSIYGNMRRIGVEGKSPVETGRFCRNGDIKK